MRILGSFCSLLCVDFFQVLGKKKLLPCQVGGEFLFALVVDGHAPVVQPILLPHDLHQGLSARSFCLRFSVFGSGNPAVSVSVRFPRPSGCFSVRGSGAVFVLGRFFRGGGFSLCSAFSVLCCLAFLHLLSRARASAGMPAAMAPDPPPVVNWAVPSHPSPAGSRPRYGLVHDGWGVRAPL